MDLFTELAALHRAGKAIVLYGMGDGADKCIACLGARGLSPDAVFASDGFVRGQSFHGMKVETFAALRERYGEDGMAVLVCFASRLPEVIGYVKSLAEKVTLRIPDLPVAVDDPKKLTEKGDIFDDFFLEKHKTELASARALFSDERSRLLFDDMLEAKRTGRIEPLFRDVSSPEEVYAELLRPKKYRICMDLGAYTGDSAGEWRRMMPNLQRILCMEPDASSYRRLCRYAEETDGGVLPLRAAAWDKEEMLLFSSKGNRNSTLLSAGFGAKTDAVPGMPPDLFVRKSVGDRPGERQRQRIDFIKYDVEGAERRALLGSRQILREDAPDLLLSLYHRPEDLFDLPLLLRELLPGGYRFYLRRMDGFPGWDLNLYAVRDDGG